MKEIWKDVIVRKNGETISFAGFYQVSNLGNVRSVDRYITYSDGRVYHYKGKMVVKMSHVRDGYLYVRLNKNQYYCHCKVHRLVAEAFIPNPDNLPTIDHIDTNKRNNVVTNLRWVTLSDNCLNSLTRKKRSEIAKATIKKALETRKAKHCKTAEHTTLQYDLNMNLIAEYQSIMEIHRKFGYDVSSIAKCCKGIKKTCYGFIWRFKDYETK